MSSYGKKNFLQLKGMISELSKTVPSILIRRLVIFSQYRGKCTEQHEFLFLFFYVTRKYRYCGDTEDVL